MHNALLQCSEFHVKGEVPWVLWHFVQVDVWMPLAGTVMA